MEPTSEELRETEDRLRQVSHSVTLNRDGTFACRRRFDPQSTPEQFLREIEHILIAGRRGKIEVLEKTIEGRSPFLVLHFLVKFRPLR